MSCFSSDFHESAASVDSAPPMDATGGAAGRGRQGGAGEDQCRSTRKSQAGGCLAVSLTTDKPIDKVAGLVTQ
jgi:hypothetical protein